MDTDTTSRPDRVEERRKQIMDAALTCFARKGYHKTTMDDIVAESGLSKGTLYWYFRSKDELFFSLVNSFFLEMRHDIDVITEQHTSASDKLGALGLEFVSFFAEVTEFLNVFFEFWMQSALNEQLNQLFHNMLVQYREEIAGIIYEGIEAGEFQEVDAKQLAWAVMAVYDGLWFYKMLAADEVDLEKANQAFLDTLLGGLVTNGPVGDH
jgi:AcrR family transcriptional regulator